jgi:50S ribosomal subunit-associated GTPase HflX
MPKQILLSEDVDGIAFFIDLSRNDDDYFQETQNLLQRVMERSKMQKVPLLFLGNKIDILTLNLAEAWERYSLQKYAKHNVKLISACALTGEGLKEGF